MRNRWLRERWNSWVGVGALLIALGLLFATALVLYVLSPSLSRAALPTPTLMVVPAPTLTPSPQPTAAVTPTQAGGGVAGDIQLGSFVQVAGTDGAGLRLRSGPGLNNPQIFLGMDEEVFEVKEGPQEVDGYQWWYLEAPYDASRSGWGAANFLTVVDKPQ